MVLEDFRKRSAHIPFFLFISICLFYLLGGFLGIFILNKTVENLEFFLVLFNFILFFFFRQNKISYSFFVKIIIFELLVLMTFVFFYNTGIVYRSLWFIAVIPFIYLYVGEKTGLFVTVYSIVLMIVAFNEERFNILFQDVVIYMITNILISAISYFFIERLQKFEQEVLKEKNRLSKQAMTDYLTNTYNRRGFLELARDKKGVLAVFDLDYFKNINDTYGHEFGDRYLQHFVGLLKQNIRKSDIIARFGGDEFVVLFEDAKEDDIKNWEKKFYEDLKKSPYKNVDISVSVGFSEVRYSIHQSYKKADRELYKIKVTRHV